MDNHLWAILDNLEFDVLCSLDELTDCLLTLKAGRFYQSSLLETHSGYQAKEPLPGWHELTPSERRVLKLTTDEKTGPQIAAILFISEKTVNNHKAKISQKLAISGGPGSLTRFVLTHRKQLLALLE
ncbi:helix-turn-helix transcriptional regulator [Spirosoma sp.]|uniref:helix-turn-helix domain-containing protein n=1 Tax=Spirosoma sp. TaxID=1899569 RepID=UPI002632FF84|nr:helix-turn-helix transcriptional regulator [Spirosoma sp.]MCX6215437.1 helix-turn-helix transcriptional regulator [Spirosoma sp.]